MVVAGQISKLSRQVYAPLIVALQTILTGLDTEIRQLYLWM